MTEHPRSKGKRQESGQRFGREGEKNSGDIEMFIDPGSQKQNGKELSSTFDLKNITLYFKLI